MQRGHDVSNMLMRTNMHSWGWRSAKGTLFTSSTPGVSVEEAPHVGRDLTRIHRSQPDTTSYPSKTTGRDEIMINCQEEAVMFRSER